REARAADPVKPPFDEVWAVFDKDDFPNARFDNAVSLANQSGIENGSSNQAFELWYVLHFQFLQTAIRREAYFAILTKLLGFRYEKNSSKVVEELFRKGSVRQAIKWAETLEKMHDGKTPSDSCPSTNIYKLVDRLLVYSNQKDNI
ncbi:MAG: RloB domain-containing protein, partial [Bacteroidetes bacterium]|nr:RloB domain-containing protein [Bacteroidota bacterium]